MQDSKGYIWFFTERGVSKFNGKTFKNFTTKDGLSRNDVWNITEDSEGRLWLHTRNNEINYIRNDSVFTVPVEGEKVLTLYTISDSEGKLFFNEKLCYLDSEDDTIKFFIETDQYRYVTKINDENYHFRAGLQKDTVVIRIDSISYNSFKMSNLEVLDSFILSDYVDLPIGYLEKIELFDNTIFSVDKNLTHLVKLNFNRKEVIKIPFIDYFDKSIKRVRLVTTEHSLQVQTDLGILIIRKESDIQVKLIESFFLKNDVSRCFLDDEENFWINTKNNGVFLKNQDLDELYSDRFINSTDQIIDFHLSNNSLIICTESGLLKKYSLNSFELIKEVKLETAVSGFVKNNLNFIVFNINDKPIFISQDLNAILIKNELTKKRFNFSERGVNECIITDEEIFFKSPTYLHLYNRNKQKLTFRLLNSTKHIEYNLEGFLFTKKNKICIVKNGIEKELFSFPKEIADFKSTGKTIIIISSGVIYEYVNDEICASYDTNLECSNFCIKDSLNLFLLTHSSIYSYNLISKKIKKIIDLDIFSGSEFNNIKYYGDVIVASSNDGIHFINYNKLERKKNPPRLNLLRSTSNNIPLVNNSSLNYENNNVDLDYDLISYNSFGKHKILYKVLLNNEMTIDFKEVEQGNIQLRNLKAGQYSLHVKGKDTYSSESPIEVFNFRIKRPFWQSLWFYLLVFICTAFIFYSVARKIIRKTEKRKDIEFKAKLKLAELELSALQSQLNPHFIFNAMGSIQGLLQVDKVDLADEYIAKFSRLMRRFLMSSKSKYIKLIHELEIIQDYIEIEKLRYNNFDFDIEIDPKIDVLSMEVPSLFIQPFVENAIAHGLFHKKGRGELKIFIEEQGEGVSIKIRDNGIGREASKIINAKSVSNYKSYGMSLIKDRLATLNSISSVPYQFSIEDLAIGTKINLWIPYNNKSAA